MASEVGPSFTVTMPAKSYRDAMVKAFCTLMNDMEKGNLSAASVHIENREAGFDADVAIRYNANPYKKTDSTLPDAATSDSVTS